MSPVSVACWSDLPLGLWVNVFSRLGHILNPTFVWDQRDRLISFAQERSNMHVLRLVCSKFKIALDDAQLSRCLFLREAFSNKILPSLLRWAKRRQTSLQLLACDVGTPALEAVLAALACTESQLYLASIHRVSQAALYILPCYSALHSIDLRSSGDRSPLLGLQPLAALPSLGKLLLADGRFEGVEALSHLTNLRLLDASVSCSTPCIWAPKLEKLRLYDSQLNMQGQGLVACQSLRTMWLRECVVNASQVDDTFALQAGVAAHFPDGMTGLTQLTSLVIALGGGGREDTNFSWLGSLTALQNLGCSAHKYVELPAELTELTGLSELLLRTAGSSDATVRMSFRVNRSRMRTLRSLSIKSGLYAFDSQLLQIVNCTAIKELHLGNVRPDNGESAMYFASLLHILATKRPDVTCYWDQVRMSNLLEEV